jgi:hypothetical protein
MNNYKLSVAIASTILLSACGGNLYQRYTPGDPCREAVRCEIIAGQPQMRDPSAQGLQPGVGGYRYSTNRDVYVIRNAQGTKIGTIK